MGLPEMQSACCSRIDGPLPTFDIEWYRAGKYSTAAGASSNHTCQHCVAGKYSSTVGADEASQCLDCALGKFSKGGYTTCTRCVVGKYGSSLGMSHCHLCPAGKFSSLSGVSVCTDCPDFSTSPESSLSKTSCVCIEGYEGPDGGPCNRITTCADDELMSFDEVATAASFVCHLPSKANI